MFYIILDIYKFAYSCYNIAKDTERGDTNEVK